jgi:geranylgeranyl reductase family protein
VTVQPPNDRVDVVIVGGGPAGLYAALGLARSGYQVEVVEEHASIGDPVHCTGVLARDAFRTFDVSSRSVLNDLNTVRFHAPSGDCVEYSTTTVEAVVIDRRQFDCELAQRAARAGVRFTQARVTDVAIQPDGVAVSAGGATIRGRACALACGASYALQRRLGLGMPRVLLQSAQAELPAGRPGDVEVHFGADVAPGGFAWAVPVHRGDRSCVRIGVMCDSDAARRFWLMVETLRTRWGLQVPDSCVPRQKVLPLAPLERTYGDRLLVLGDAAGLVKATTGGGIYYSLLSGQLAADVLGRALADGTSEALEASRLAEYQKAWRRRLGAELRWQLILRRIAQRLSDHDIDGLFELAHTDGLMPLVRRTASFNHHGDFIVALLKHPPARRVLFRAALA